MVKSNVYHKKEWTELDLQKALDQYWALEPKAHHRGVSKIAIACGVPHHTLDNRINGKHRSAMKSQYEKQLLTEVKEDVLADWVQYCSDTACPLCCWEVDELCKIAWGLGLKEERLKDDLIDTIKCHLDSHPNLGSIEGWAGLFEHGQQCCAVPESNNKNLLVGPPQPIHPLPSTLIAHVHYLDPPSTQVLSPWGLYQSFIPYQPPQYIQYSHTTNIHPLTVHPVLAYSNPTTISWPLTATVLPNTVYSSAHPN